jgi:hypothetical protein
MTKSKEQMLVVIPSFHDPHLPGKPAELGNIATLMQRETFQHVFMFGFNIWKLNVFLTEQYINQRYPHVKTSKEMMPVKNTFSYKEIFYSLKQALYTHKSVFSDKKRSVSFLLPPSFCDKLLDCWLLLLTSLNIPAKIYQIEPHYSLETTIADSLWNKNFDWLSEQNIETHEPGQLSKANKNDSGEQAGELARTLEVYESSDKNLLVVGQDESTHHYVDAWLRHNVRVNGIFLRVECDQIPTEICDEILFGYRRTIAENKIIAKKGLLCCGEGGIVHVSRFEALPVHVQSKLVDFIGPNAVKVANTRFVLSAHRTKQKKDCLLEVLEGKLDTVEWDNTFS